MRAIVCLFVAVNVVAVAGPARLAGTLWWVSPADVARDAASWREELDALQRVGMRLMVLNGAQYGEDASAPDALAVLFEEADARGIDLYLDTLQAPDWWTQTDPAPEVARARGRIARLMERYGGHTSFKGWYIPYEFYVFWGPPADLIKRLHVDIGAACKEAAPGKPVLISPFFILDQKGVLGDFRWATPGEYEDFWKTLLAAAPVDIVALQDSGEHLSCYTLDERRPFFEAMKNACAATGKQFWANVESGELHVESVDDYVERFGLKTHVNDAKTTAAWRGVPAERFRAKLELAGEYTPVAITWGYQQFLRPASEPAAERLHQAYVKALAADAK